MQTQNQCFEDLAFVGKFQACNTVTKSPLFQPCQLLSEKELMETSFGDNISEDHTTAIWKASLEFLKNSLKQQFDHNKGFNDEQIFDSELNAKDECGQKMEILELVSRNSILSNSEKEIFIQGLKQEKELKSLVENTSAIFCEEIFQEIAVIFYESWEKFLSFKETTKMNEQLRKILAPSFTNITLNFDSIQNSCNQQIYFPESDQKIIQKADESGEQIASCYFNSTKIRFINLKQAQTIPSKSHFIRKQFQTFIQVIAKAVFLCSSGCFFHPNGVNDLEALLDDENGTYFDLTNKVCQFEDCEEEQGNISRKRRNS